MSKSKLKNWAKVGLLSVLWCGGLGQTPAQDAESQSAALDRLPKVWQERVHRLTREEFEATLSFWAEKFAPTLTVTKLGESAEGLGIFQIEITDTLVPDTDKQRALITALHGGPERSGTTACLHLIEWLLGESPEAVETRRKQRIRFIPVPNPYAYFVTDRFGNSLKIDPYTGGGVANWDLKTVTFKALDRSPEIRAVIEAIDDFQPEVHLDLHGTGLQ
ncbi:MAG: hypothetical protein KDM63_08655, partial [Verrucomicrobiae bacterium]|nr:hypothetical protein [Verrucomicrobiae bacterium]